MVQLNSSHTGFHLAEIIVNRLKEFGVTLNQIVAITTDNGSNMLKMVKDICKMDQNAASSNTQPQPKTTTTTNNTT